MTLKPCPGCKKILTTKNVKSHGQVEGMLYFTCLGCKSTSVLPSRARTLELEIFNMAMEDNARLRKVS